MQKKFARKNARLKDVLGEWWVSGTNDGARTFTLSSKAFLQLCLGSGRAETTFFLPFGDKQDVGIVWTETKEKEYMVFQTFDKGSSFFLVRAKTNKIHEPSGKEVSFESSPNEHYYIDISDF